MMKNARTFLISAIVFLVAAFFYFDMPQFLSLEFIKSQQANIIAFRDHHVLLAIVIYGLIYIAVTGLSLPGAAVLTLAGGAFLGLFWGTMVVSFASTIGATLAFLMARFLFKDKIQAKFEERFQVINEGIIKEGVYYLFTLRLVPLFPFFLINILMGLTAISTWTFYWVSQVGMFAGTLVYVNAGTQLAKISTLSDILSPALVGSFVLLGIFPLIAKKFIEHFPHD